MIPTIIAYVAITLFAVASGAAVHWHHPYRNSYSLSRKSEWYIRSFAFWGLFVAFIAGMCASSTYNDTGRSLFMQYVSVGVIVFIPTAVLAAAMFLLRQPTPPRVMRREMDLNK